MNSTSTKEKILVVEDNFVSRQIICKILGQYYQVQEAENGLNALELLKQQSDYSAIILDLFMPVMNGFEFLEAYKKEGFSSIPVLVTTGEQDAEIEEKALLCGATDFVTKPVNPHILLKRIQNAVAHSKMYLMDQLRYMADFDQITGLYNRDKLFREIQKMVDENHEKQFVFVRFEMKKYHEFNSSLGEEAGANLLRYVGNILQKKGENNSLFRYGRMEADVFCFCEEYKEDSLEKQMKDIHDEIKAYRSYYLLESSFGVYVINDKNCTAATMFTRATLASAQCNTQINQFYSYYDAAIEEKMRLNQAVENEMQHALDTEQFAVYLQPKYNITTNQPCGAEALVRWIHPEKGLISPGIFIPVFEQNGFIANLDYYMWEHVCQLIQKWLREGKNPPPVSVNISRISMYNPDVAQQLHDLVEKYEIPVDLFELEITESAYMANQNLMEELIAKLKHYGFKLLMDDFGSGYSSLNTLKEIDVDTLKIDIKFLPTSDSNGKSEKILSAVVRMAGWIGMSVIVEGVETKEQKDFLQSIGCEHVQGFYFSRPVPVEDYEKIVFTVPLIKESQIKEEDLSDVDMVWTANPQIEGLLRGISLPVAMFEYTGDEIEIIRANVTYDEAFGFRHSASVLEANVVPEQRFVAKMAFKKAAETQSNVECIVKVNSGKWYRLKLQFLKKSKHTCILCGVFLDVTGEKEYEERMEKMTSLFQLQSQKGKMLVVDDMELSRALTRDLFEDKYEIIEAKDGEEGMQLLKENAEDVVIILLDMLMPKMDGKQFLAIKNQSGAIKDIPVVVISSENDNSQQINMLKLGVNDYIVKPFIPEIAKRRVENVIEYNSRFQKMIQEYQVMEKQEGGQK